MSESEVAYAVRLQVNDTIDAHTYVPIYGVGDTIVWVPAGRVQNSTRFVDVFGSEYGLHLYDRFHTWYKSHSRLRRQSPTSS